MRVGSCQNAPFQLRRENLSIYLAFEPFEVENYLTLNVHSQIRDYFGN